MDKNDRLHAALLGLGEQVRKKRLARYLQPDQVSALPEPKAQALEPEQRQDVNPGMDEHRADPADDGVPDDALAGFLNDEGKKKDKKDDEGFGY